MFDDADAGSASPDEVATGVQTNVTETLDYEGLTAPAGSRTYNINLYVWTWIEKGRLRLDLKNINIKLSISCM